MAGLEVNRGCPADLGDIVLLLLAGTLAGLGDRLVEDGFERAAEVVADLVEIVDQYLTDAGAIDLDRRPMSPDN